MTAPAAPLNNVHAPVPSAPNGTRPESAAPPVRPGPQGLSPLMVAGIFAVPVMMLLIGLFVFRPLYSMWCQISNSGLRPNNAAVAAAASVHTGRFVTVYFGAKVYDDLPVKFWGDQDHAEVEVGIDGNTQYHFKNMSDHVVRLRPVHGLSPSDAVPAFGMKVCFCFNDQVLQPGEEKTYPVIFTFSPTLDERVHTVSLDYFLFAKTGDGAADESSLQTRISTSIPADEVVSPRHPAAAAATATSATTPATVKDQP